MGNAWHHLNPSLSRICQHNDDPKDQPSSKRRTRQNSHNLRHTSYAQQLQEQQRRKYVAALGFQGREGLQKIHFDFRLKCDDSSNHDGDDDGGNNILQERLVYLQQEDGNNEKDSSSSINEIFITEENLSKYILEGEMYEVVARLCQEYAQEVLMKEGDLVWRTLYTYDNDSDPNLVSSSPNRPGSHRPHQHSKNEKYPIRALVSREFRGSSSLEQKDSNTLIIITGRGKVRCGIFSRRFLMTKGVVEGTCLNYVREARKRGMNIVILDPNVNTEREGMFTTLTSMEALFDQTSSLFVNKHQDTISMSTNFAEEKKQIELLDSSSPDENDSLEVPKSNLFILSHSASGGNLVRILDEYLQKTSDELSGMNESEELVLTYKNHRIRSIAFTDSTHNIQWVKSENTVLKSFLQCEKFCVYIKSSNVRTDDNWKDRCAGDEVDTDHFWKHRFGTIKTLYAGTHEHSLINHTAERYIWDHFLKSLPSSEIM